MTTLSTGCKLPAPWLLISEHHKVAEHALAMLKVVYSREGPNAAVESAKHMVVVAAAVISQELGPAEAQRFLQVSEPRREPIH